jgi:hypothetical protein
MASAVGVAARAARTSSSTAAALSMRAKYGHAQLALGVAVGVEGDGRQVRRDIDGGSNEVAVDDLVGQSPRQRISSAVQMPAEHHVLSVLPKCVSEDL